MAEPGGYNKRGLLDDEEWRMLDTFDNASAILGVSVRKSMVRITEARDRYYPSYVILRGRESIRRVRDALTRALNEVPA